MNRPGPRPIHRVVPPVRTDPRPPVVYMTVAEVAARLRVSKMTIYRLVHAEELAAIRAGRSIRIPDTGVAAYLRSVENGGPQ